MRLGALLALGLTALSCTSRAPDPRSRIVSEDRHLGVLAKSVNGSKLWRAYFEEMDPSASHALVEIHLDTERKTRKSYGGDYDPGTIDVRFTVRSLESGRDLFSKKTSVELDSFVIGPFDENTTREEIQEVAFRAIEKRVYPYVDRWINIAAIRAMGEVGKGGEAFIEPLEAVEKDPWSEQLSAEARTALAKIRGPA